MKAVVVLVILLGLLAAPPAGAEVKLVPGLSVSERYDSNLLFAPTLSRSDREDFITTITPSVRALYFGRPIEGALFGSLSVAHFAKNRQRNFVAAAGGLNLDLGQLVGRLDQRASLQIADTVVYTPEMPTFLAETEAAGFNPFATGIQPRRVSIFRNTASVTGGYTLTPRTSLRAVYTHSILRFGGLEAPQPGTRVFGTTFQTVSAGPHFQVTPLDTLQVTYLHSRANFDGGLLEGFVTHGGTAGWTRTLSPTLSMSLAGGLSIITPGDILSPLVDAALRWSPSVNTSLALTYTRSVRPSFTVAALPLDSQVVKLALTHRILDPLTLLMSAGYAHNESTLAGTDLLFRTYQGIVGLKYAFSRILSGRFTYTYTRYFRDFPAAGQSQEFDRHQVLALLAFEWQ